MTWQNRIIGYKEEPPEQLLANPHNPRRHPAQQRETLRASLDTIGIIDEITVNQRTGRLIDGHARVEEYISAGIPLVPVKYVDLSEEEELKAIAIFDAISALADYDQESLESLLDTIELDSEPLESMLDDLTSKTKPKKEKKPIECPECGHVF